MIFRLPAGTRVSLLLSFFMLCWAPVAAGQQTQWGTLEPADRPEIDKKISDKSKDPNTPGWEKDDIGESPGPIAIQTPSTFLGQAGFFPVDYSVQQTFRSKVYGQNASMSYLRQDMDVNVPLYKQDETWLLVFTLSMRALNFNTTAMLPNSRVPFPKHLYDVDPGLFFRHQFENGWIFGIEADIGTPSDKPFHSFHELNPFVTAYLKTPRDNGDAWLFSVFYQPVSEIPYPLPGIAYQWNPSKDLQVNIGVPFDIRWRFCEKWRLEAGYLPIRRVKSYLFYELTDQVQLFTGFEWNNDAYLLADRVITDNFLFSYDKRLSIGARWEAPLHIMLDVQGGYIFDQLYFSGRTYNDENYDRVAVKPSAYVQLRLGLKF